jgi:formylglycine-generating enzyme required for sulfatase activity
MRHVLTLALLATVLLTGCGDDPATPEPDKGVVIVDIEPDAIGATWTLDGPDSYTHDGTGDERLPDRVVGNYTVTWDEVLNYSEPFPMTQILAVDDSITFHGTYTYDPLPTGTVSIDPDPDDLNIGWVLKVVDGGGTNDRSGFGNRILENVPTGPLTVEWEPEPGWLNPAPGYEDAVLLGGATLDLSVTFTLLPAWPREYALVAPGTFMMGSPTWEPGAVSDEWPHHEVTLTRGFWAGVTEVTNAQWDEVMGDKREGDPTVANLPVTMVNWRDAVDYCIALSIDEGLAPAYEIVGLDVIWTQDAPGYRLPTEAEWEYLCRAGTTTAISAGELAVINCDPDPVLTYFGWYCPNSSGARQPVRSLYPNDWGLYDVHGNVGEWCWDVYGDGFYAMSPSEDPTGPELGTNRVVRGGNYGAWGSTCRSAARGSYNPGPDNPAVGFRVVRNVEPPKAGADK